MFLFSFICVVEKSLESSRKETPPLQPKLIPSLPIFGAPNLNGFDDDKDIVLSEVKNESKIQISPFTGLIDFLS